MSKSLKRVLDTLTATGHPFEILEMPAETRTAADAAHEVGCEIDQIAKSIIFRGDVSARALLFITAGGNQVEPVRAEALVGEPLGRADPAFVRENTGYAIGGVAPVGHKTPMHVFFDPRLLDFELIYAAAGTPRHIFSINPNALERISESQRADFTYQN